MKPIALFTIPNCKWCKDAITYFKVKKLKYNLIDLSNNKIEFIKQRKDKRV